MRLMELPVTSLHSVQLNPARRDADAVSRYSETLDSLPPGKAIFDGKHYWLWDGNHTMLAHTEAGRKTMRVEVEDGTKREAILRAAAANEDARGLPRTNEDKRQAVLTLLRDPEWQQWSDREIARTCKVSQPFVSDMRVVAEPSENAGRFATVKRSARKFRRGGKTIRQSVPDRSPLKDALSAAARLLDKALSALDGTGAKRAIGVVQRAQDALKSDTKRLLERKK